MTVIRHGKIKPLDEAEFEWAEGRNRCIEIDNPFSK
jgi:hypothetical protein